ncbi:complement C1q-like protein 2 [Anabas testudineus]|uniref:complement C1q-like protein 2 n=1 Tax=Anabas testudineus TaxID=64144 RepID=UPI000E45E563|nr:complement C1q-like protein 2 [Anabas testudineus]
MESMFFLLLLVSSSMCAENYSYLGTGTSLAVCQPDTCALLSDVAAMREKLIAATQTKLKLEQNLSDMMQKMTTIEADLKSYKSQAEELWKINKAQDEQLKTLTDVSTATTSKMAFSAALGVSVGPFQQDTALKYQRILTNIGSGYNPATGIFTARVRGVYYFRYTMYNNNAGQPNSVVSLMMNSQKLVSTWDTVGNDNHDSATNAAVVQLEAGDSVFVQLWASRVLYDDGLYYNTFSGFLLFTL